MTPKRTVGSDPVAGPLGGQRRPPDPTPYRLALGLGGLAAASALVTAIIGPGGSAPALSAGPQTGGVVSASTGAATGPATQARTITQQRPVSYVQLQPGQTAPPGATVIDAKAPKPITVVTTVPAPPQQTVVVRTTQSGRVLP